MGSTAGPHRPRREWGGQEAHTPPASKWHTAAAASGLLDDLFWPPPYLPQWILMLQVSDECQVLSKLGSAWPRSEAGVFRMHGGQDSETSRKVGKATTPQKCSRPLLRASQSRPPEFTRGMVDGSRGRWQDHQAPGRKGTQVPSGWLASPKCTREEHFQAVAFLGSSPTHRQEAGWS